MGKPSFEIAFETGQSKGVIAATGAFGGLSPDQASVVAHLFVEHGSVPNIIQHDIEEGTDRVMLETGRPIQRAHLTRSIQATLVLSPRAAVELGKWLIDHGTKGLGADGSTGGGISQ